MLYRLFAFIMALGSGAFIVALLFTIIKVIFESIKDNIESRRGTSTPKTQQESSSQPPQSSKVQSQSSKTQTQKDYNPVLVQEKQDYIVQVDGIVYGTYDNIISAKNRITSVASEYSYAVVYRSSVSGKELVYVQKGTKDDDSSKIDPEVIDIFNYLKERGVNYLVHFTPVANLENILKYGIIPRAKLSPSNAVFLDSLRLDYMTDCSCFSLSFPNYKMFNKYRESFPQKYAILFIDLKYILKVSSENLYFFPTNAANSSFNGKRFQMQGIDVVKTLFSSTNRSSLIPDSYTTDPQAEVLIRSIVRPKFFREVHTLTTLGDLTVKNASLECSFEISDEYFHPRIDYKDWSPSNNQDY